MCKGGSRSSDRSHLFVYLHLPKMAKLVTVPVYQSLIDTIRGNQSGTLDIEWNIIPDAGDLVCLEAVGPHAIADSSSYIYLYITKMVASHYKGLHEAEYGSAKLTFNVIDRLEDIEL